MTHALIIDDDKFNLEVLGRLLKASGVESTPVNDPTKVSALLQTAPAFDLVFLDLEMPRINGYAMLDILRESLGDVPVIACTVHINEISTAQELGFAGFISKPLDSALFPDQVHRILNGEMVWEV